MAKPRLDFLLNTAPPRKSTLLVKIFDLDPEKKFCYILVNELSTNFKFHNMAKPLLDFLLNTAPLENQLY